MFAAIAQHREPLEKLFESIYQVAMSEIPGDVIENDVPIEDAGGALFESMVDVCGGTQTKAERLGHREFAIYRIGHSI